MGSSGPIKGKAGVTGTAMRGLVITPERRQREIRKRESEEARWARLAGPVTVTHVSEHE